MRRLKIWAIGLPLVLLLVLFALEYVFFERMLTRTEALVLTFALAATGVAVFSLVIWRLIERAEGRVRSAYEAERRQTEQLEALSAAALSLTADLELESVLQKVVDLSRRVIGARYGALAVVGPGGQIEEFFTSGIDPVLRARLGPPPQGKGILGVVIRERRVLRSDDITADPRAVGFPVGHPFMRRLLAVPVVYEDEVIGSLYVAERDDDQPFTEQNQRALERFAAQAAIAVANARLYAAALRVSVVEERQRIAMDLHDGAIQSIYGVSLALEACLDRVRSEPEAVEAEVDAAIGRLDGVIEDIRRYVLDLRQGWLRDDGFPRLIKRLLDSVAGGRELKKTLVTEGEFSDVPRREQWELWHVAHEALSNSMRHAEARRIDVHLSRDDGKLRLTVKDDGCGFDLTQAAAAGHQGLVNMQRRVAALGGRLQIESVPGGGTSVSAEVPVQEGEDGPNG